MKDASEANDTRLAIPDRRSGDAATGAVDCGEWVDVNGTGAAVFDKNKFVDDGGFSEIVDDG